MLAVLAFLMGASVGSFLNLVGDRMPAGKSIVFPRSFCDGCNRQLSSRELVPILSYIWLRGKCRTCATKIPLRILAVEAISGAIFAAIFFKFDMGTEFVILAVAVSLLLLVALIDLEHGLILNKVIFPSLVILLVLSPFWTELGLPRSFLGNEDLLGTFVNSVLTGLGTFLVFLGIAMVYPNGMGGGDVKLGGVIGLLVGYPGALIALWLAVVSAGAIAIALVVLRKLGRKDTMPFGPFLSMGAIVALVAGGDITGWYIDLADFLAG